MNYMKPRMKAANIINANTNHLRVVEDHMKWFLDSSYVVCMRCKTVALVTSEHCISRDCSISLSASFAFNLFTPSGQLPFNLNTLHKMQAVYESLEVNSLHDNLLR